MEYFSIQPCSKTTIGIKFKWGLPPLSLSPSLSLFYSSPSPSNIHPQTLPHCSHTYFVLEHTHKRVCEHACTCVQLVSSISNKARRDSQRESNRSFLPVMECRKIHSQVGAGLVGRGTWFSNYSQCHKINGKVAAILLSGCLALNDTLSVSGYRRVVLKCRYPLDD